VVVSAALAISVLIRLTARDALVTVVTVVTEVVPPLGITGIALKLSFLFNI
jgi:hypothetical protein